MAISVTKDAKKKTLTIILPLEAAGTMSASGKNIIVATTRGNQPVDLGDGSSITIGVNAYTKP
tara:strand:- start:27 stop:215 length:189 start_codon:yes stop_codon:yes gene_type:complete